MAKAAGAARSVRVGVDVGGTFTKAVAYDLSKHELVGQAIVPTTHAHADGVAAGVVDVVGQLVKAVGAKHVELVTHSTTQAVNALLEGDVALVGMVGMGRQPDLRKTRKRTVEPHISLGESKSLTKVAEFVDVTHGLTQEVADALVARLVAQGVGAIAVAEAFSPDDTTNENVIVDAATAAGIPATSSAELTGLYGLELRAVTAAINASILPIAIRTAEVVGSGVAAAGVTSPVMVMRGDAGATDLEGFRKAPARTLYSGPAASVAGALRLGGIGDAVIVEVGGTSTNVAAIRRGRPALSYVQVSSHATAIRALDVRVFGVAGGSMLRARKGKVYAVGPRSAHIAGLPYSCFLTPEQLQGAVVEEITPKDGDPADYVALRLTDGSRAALTVTCASNALGLVQADDYAHGDQAAAKAAFAVAGAHLRLSGDEVARRMLVASTQAIGELVEQVIADQKLEKPSIVAVGGGAGGLGRAVAQAMGLGIVVPEHAEVISAIGDALSLIRAEREQTIHEPTAQDIQRLVEQVEEEAIAAGASAVTIEVRVEQVVERGAVRVTATGSVGLSSGAIPGREPASKDDLAQAASNRSLGNLTHAGDYWIATAEDKSGTRVGLFDRYAELVIDIKGEAIEVAASTDATVIGAVLDRRTKRVGPVTIKPDVWLVSGSRFLQLAETDPVKVAQAAATFSTDESSTTMVIGRE